MENLNNKIQMSKQKLKALPFRKIAPNVVTMMALCSGVTSIRYTKLNTAIRMAIEFYRDIDVFQNEEQDESYRLHIKCAITETRPNGAPNLSSFVWAILGQTYDDEILTTETLKILYDEQDKDKYEFEYLGEKEFEGLEKSVNLYKIIYN